MDRTLVLDRASEIADELTIERARRGDPEAMAEIWTIYQPGLLALLRSLRAVGVEDVASQVWVDVGRSIDRFEGDGSAFRRWMNTIARRRAVDEGRRVFRRREVQVESLAHVSLTPSSDDDGWDASLDSAVGLLGQLSPTTAEVVMLRVVCDMSVARVAEITGLSEGNVRVMLHRGLTDLREHMNSEDDDAIDDPIADSLVDSLVGDRAAAEYH